MRPVDLHFTDSGGPGEAVLLAHAIGCDHRMWDDLAARLAPRFRVVAIDARGHGRSPVPRRPYTLELLADDACAVLDRLGISRAHWVGLSMGGMVGQAFALRHPARINRLVIANSTSTYGDEGRPLWQGRIKMVQEGGLAAIRDNVEARYFSESFRQREPARVEAVMTRFLETPAEGYLGCCDAISHLDFADDLVRIKARTLVIAGEADVGTPPAMSQAIAARIPGARLATIPGAAHLSVAEAPEEFARLVVDFLGAPG
ncbi:MAG TPA: 3-oxoadipate enol-lactonase [Usitatibacter sp.]|nr:3-oxoadipate enol-lactonase [Usitatibacter sp.]